MQILTVVERSDLIRILVATVHPMHTVIHTFDLTRTLNTNMQSPSRRESERAQFNPLPQNAPGEHFLLHWQLL